MTNIITQNNMCYNKCKTQENATKTAKICGVSHI